MVSAVVCVYTGHFLREYPLVTGGILYASGIGLIFLLAEWRHHYQRVNEDLQKRGVSLPFWTTVYIAMLITLPFLVPLLHPRLERRANQSSGAFLNAFLR
jgi:ferric iron reductase protein FhuF